MPWRRKCKASRLHFGRQESHCGIACFLFVDFKLFGLFVLRSPQDHIYIYICVMAEDVTEMEDKEVLDHRVAPWPSLDARRL